MRGRAEQAHKRATDLYDRLREDNARSDAIELADSIEEVAIKSQVKARTALATLNGKDTTAHFAVWIDKMAPNCLGGRHEEKKAEA
jgi:hypothetical protein